MTGQGRWEDEIVKRIEGNISAEYYTDIILPITFDGVWVLMTFNYDKRQV